MLVQTKGLKPEGCILERDNWCGFEVPSYTDEQGCWAVSSSSPSFLQRIKLTETVIQKLLGSSRRMLEHGSPDRLSTLPDLVRQMHGARRIMQQQGVPWSAKCRPGSHAEEGFVGGVDQDIWAGRTVAYQEKKTYSCLALRVNLDIHLEAIEK